MTDDIQHIWRDDKEEGLTMSTEDLIRRTTRFESRIRRRNWTEYAASALVIAVFGWMAIIIPGAVAKVGCLAIIAGTLLVMRNLRRYGPSPSDGAGLAANCRAFYRSELIRQRDALRSVTRWYLAPFIPGIVLFEAGVGLGLVDEMPVEAVAVTIGISAAIVVAIFAGIRWLNHRAARRLDREIATIGTD
jgi:hypothetical protein